MYDGIASKNNCNAIYSHNSHTNYKSSDLSEIIKALPRKIIVDSPTL